MAVFHRRVSYVKSANMAGNGHRRSLSAKPEVEIWRKPDKWTRSHRLPIRLPLHYGVYLDAMCHFSRESLPLRPCKQASDFEIRYFLCRFDFFGFAVWAKIFAIIRPSWDLELYAVWRAEWAFLLFWKPIWSKSSAAISVKFSYVVWGCTVPRGAKTHQNWKCTFVPKGGQIWQEKSEIEPPKLWTACRFRLRSNICDMLLRFETTMSQRAIFALFNRLCKN